MLDALKESTEDLISEDFKEQAQRLRKKVVNVFEDELIKSIPTIKKGRGRCWTIQLNEHAQFYVSLVFPKYMAGDSRFEIIYHIEPYDSKNLSVENQIGHSQKVVSFPYKIHRHLFEFPNTPWWKEKVGIFYWTLLMQRKKLYYYTDAQTNYTCKVLIPHAIASINKGYRAALSIYADTDMKPKSVGIYS